MARADLTRGQIVSRQGAVARGDPGFEIRELPENGIDAAEVDAFRFDEPKRTARSTTASVSRADPRGASSGSESSYTI